jgi:hypothetical protein
MLPLAGFLLWCRLPLSFPSVRELGFPLFVGGVGTLLWSQWEVLGPCASWGCKPFCTAHWVVVYSFPLLSGESGIPAFWRGKGDSPAVRHGEEYWASVHLGRQVPTEQHVKAFLLSVGNLVFLFFERGVGTLLLLGTVGSAGLLCTLGGRPPSSCRVADCNSVEELGFQLLARGDWTFL